MIHCIGIDTLKYDTVPVREMRRVVGGTAESTLLDYLTVVGWGQTFFCVPFHSPPGTQRVTCNVVEIETRWWKFCIERLHNSKTTTIFLPSNWRGWLSSPTLVRKRRWWEKPILANQNLQYSFSWMFWKHIVYQIAMLFHILTYFSNTFVHYCHSDCMII